MNIEHGLYEVYYQFWPKWFGTERPRRLTGKEIIERSNRWHLSLPFLLDQCFIVSYNTIDEEDIGGSLAGGWGKEKHFNDYVPKYCALMFEKQTEEYPGNVFKYTFDQMKGVDKSVYRIYARPARGMRAAFLKRINKWLNYVNYKTNNGQADGYPAKLLYVHQPVSSSKKSPLKNRPGDYVIVQIPKVYVDVMVSDGYFPAVEIKMPPNAKRFDKSAWQNGEKWYEWQRQRRIATEKRKDEWLEERYAKMKAEGKEDRRMTRSPEALREIKTRKVNVIC